MGRIPIITSSATSSCWKSCNNDTRTSNSVEATARLVDGSVGCGKAEARGSERMQVSFQKKVGESILGEDEGACGQRWKWQDARYNVVQQLQNLLNGRKTRKEITTD